MNGDVDNGTSAYHIFWIWYLLSLERRTEGGLRRGLIKYVRTEQYEDRGEEASAPQTPII